jgi:hypothetical protein
MKPQLAVIQACDLYHTYRSLAGTTVHDHLRHPNSPFHSRLSKRSGPVDFTGPRTRRFPMAPNFAT